MLLLLASCTESHKCGNVAIHVATSVTETILGVLCILGCSCMWQLACITTSYAQHLCLLALQASNHPAVVLSMPCSCTLQIDGHGNFGSVDNDPAAAMRYTECRLHHFSSATFLADLDSDTVDFTPNFDASQVGLFGS